MLVVLWLSAALATIAFSLAHTVRGESERTATALDGVRSYYLATGAIERALLYMQWGPQFRFPDGSSRYYAPWMPELRFSFPTGDAVVKIVPAAAKLNINSSPPEDLFRLMLALNVNPDRAGDIVRAIIDWRRPAPVDQISDFDTYYLSLTPSFRAPHASFEEIEELLLVKGMTPELFYGGFTRDPQGRLIPQIGLKDCVSVWGSAGPVDVNSAPLPVLEAIGLSPATAATIAQARQASPFRTVQQLQGFSGGMSAGRLRIGGGTIFTLMATARLRLPDGTLSDLRRSVGATVKFSGYGNPPYQVLRWQDDVWVR